VRALLLENSKHENLKQVDVARVTAGLAVLAEEQGFHDEAHRLLDTVSAPEACVASKSREACELVKIIDSYTRCAVLTTCGISAGISVHCSCLFFTNSNAIPACHSVRVAVFV
jgi:hypothetical protein